MKFSIATIVTILASSALAAPAKEIVQRSQLSHASVSGAKFMKRQVPIGMVTGVLSKIPGADKVAQLGSPPGEDAHGNTNSVNTSDPQAVAAANKALQEERQLEQGDKQRNAAQEADPDNGQDDGTTDGSDTDDSIPTQQDNASGTTTASATGTTSTPAATTAPAPAAAPPAPQRDTSGLGGLAGVMGPLTSFLGGGLPIKK